ncbi:hypothetical protein [Enterocloster hominis (ex Hitch et al. 2024)]|uniref:Uncharacterized protein n=1 Tax=Enterocloster hominis (ex Hitch et al. 2024) TaxID=1917870 RepID=A0ABV1D5X8_9FIRM
MEEKLKVIISRAHQRFGMQKSSEISVSKINDVHWSNISGGVNQRQHGYSLYGYISYKDAPTYVNCSGLHDYESNEAKVLIHKETPGSEYYPGYRYLVKQAGSKPTLPVRKTRLNGEPPCTKKILILLKRGPKTRGDIRNELSALGYETSRIRNAINQLKRQNKIICTGSPCSAFQEIRLNDNSS